MYNLCQCFATPCIEFISDGSTNYGVITIPPTATPTLAPGTTLPPTKLPTVAPTARQYNYTVVQAGTKCQDSFMAW